jgi:hypothetical protein
MKKLIVLLFALTAVADEPARLWVRLVDEQGAPTAARIFLRDAAGKPYAPSGSLAREISRTNEMFFHAAGQFQLEMPVGDATVEAVKSFEYVPVKQPVRLAIMPKLVPLVLFS